MFFESCISKQGNRRFSLTIMSRREHSDTPLTSPRPFKRARLNHLNSESFKNGVVLAPMVRSGSLPTRLFALKHGAKLVWSPEIVDKAILHSERVVDPETGVISYNGKSKAIFTTHPIEKPYLVYQIGSADPDLAVQAARTVIHDVSGIDLNCGCPKPFSTHSGMGAALLTNPDLLCSILTALRRDVPPEITVSAKIRLLPTQEETLELVKRIADTGVSTISVHCRTRNMRKQEKAVVGRLREIVEFVESLGKGIAVIANGDCLGLEDSKRLRDLTHAHSCMIATAAEANPTCFSVKPLVDLERTFIPPYIRLARYLDNHFSNTKFCATQFNGTKTGEVKKSERKSFREILSHAKSYDDLSDALDNIWDGEKEMQAIMKAIEARSHNFHIEGPRSESPTKLVNGVEEVQFESISEQLKLSGLVTPPESRANPQPEVLSTPRVPLNESRMAIPPMISGKDHPTPSPTPSPESLSYTSLTT